MTEAIAESDALYAYDLVKVICNQVGPGLPSSVQEKDRAAMIAAALAAHLGAANVVMEEFSLAPGAFLGSLPTSAFFLLGAAILNFATSRLSGVTPWAATLVSLAFSIIALLAFVLEYVQYREFLDRFFKKRQSVNVVGTLRKPATKEVKRLLILSGHHDSALENTWIGALGYGLYVTVPTIFIGLVTMAVMSLIQLAGLIAADEAIVHFGTLSWVLWVYPIAPAIIFAMFFNRGRKNGGTVPGAADNLSASALLVALCRFLVNNPACIPPETEIRFISFGSEEAGLRGSRRYAARHLNELNRLDARLLNFETVAHPEIGILTSDVNGVKNSPPMVQSVIAAAERAGVPYKVKANPVGAGGTDAGSFSQAGLKAATLLPFKVPQQLVAFYHQKQDSPEILTIEPLFNVLKLALEWIRHGGK